MKEQGLKWLRTHDLISNKQRNRIYEKVQHQKAYVESRKDAPFVLSETSSEMDGSAKKKKSGKGRKNPRQTAVDEWTFLYMEESQKTMSTEIQMTHFWKPARREKKRELFFSQCQNKQLAHTRNERAPTNTQVRVSLEDRREFFFFVVCGTELKKKSSVLFF